MEQNTEHASGALEPCPCLAHNHVTHKHSCFAQALISCSPCPQSCCAQAPRWTSPPWCPWPQQAKAGCTGNSCEGSPAGPHRFDCRGAQMVNCVVTKPSREGEALLWGISQLRLSGVPWTREACSGVDRGRPCLCDPDFYIR
eukprot:1137360-Pelagomonas_calceolata.AAC.9